MNAITPHIVAAPVDLEPHYITRLKADVADHKRDIADLKDRIDRTLREIG